MEQDASDEVVLVEARENRRKRRRMDNDDDDCPILRLPAELVSLIATRVPCRDLATLRATCHALAASWPAARPRLEASVLRLLGYRFGFERFYADFYLAVACARIAEALYEEMRDADMVRMTDGSTVSVDPISFMRISATGVRRAMVVDHPVDPSDIRARGEKPLPLLQIRLTDIVCDGRA